MSREDLKNYCLRRLGEPLIKINISEQQIEDRIDDALNFFSEFHMEGREELYLKHKITCSKLNTTTMTGIFSTNEKVVGQTSGAYSYVINTPTVNTQLKIYKTEGTFVPGETVTGQVSGATLVVTTYVVGDLDNRWIPVTDDILSVVKVLPVSNYNMNGNDNLFNIQYEFMMDSMNNFNKIDMQSYYLFKQHLALIEKMFAGEKGTRFNRYTNKLYIDMNWNATGLVDRHIIILCHAIVNPTSYIKIYSDRWLREYTTSLFKQQWGSNLKKFGGLQLPGGVTLNGQDIFSEATDEIKNLREEARTIYMEPAKFFIG